MQNEISSGTMLGIVLIALAAVIGLGFGVFSIAKGVSNEGVVNVQDNLSVVSDSAYTDYDQKVVTGTQVVAAYKGFQGKSVAILINTQAMNKGVKTLKGHTAYALSIGVPGAVQYLNYNALLAATAIGGSPVALSNAGIAVGGGTAGIVLVAADGVPSATYGFALDPLTSKVVYDSSIGGFSKAGNCEYIASSAKFDAAIIKDASGSTVGVIFTQLAK